MSRNIFWPMGPTEESATSTLAELLLVLDRAQNNGDFRDNGIISRIGEDSNTTTTAATTSWVTYESVSVESTGGKVFLIARGVLTFDAAAKTISVRIVDSNSNVIDEGEVISDTSSGTKTFILFGNAELTANETFDLQIQEDSATDTGTSQEVKLAYVHFDR